METIHAVQSDKAGDGRQGCIISICFHQLKTIPWGFIVCFGSDSDKQDTYIIFDLTERNRGRAAVCFPANLAFLILFCFFVCLLAWGGTCSIFYFFSRFFYLFFSRYFFCRDFGNFSSFFFFFSSFSPILFWLQFIA